LSVESPLVGGPRFAAGDIGRWLNSGDYFEAATKYMALADKASRMVALLSERIDQHRTGGKQQIIVKHVTVHADQAVVTDKVVTGNPAANAVLSPALLVESFEKPMAALAARFLSLRNSAASMASCELMQLANGDRWAQEIGN
jgi:hypothetical protein